MCARGSRCGYLANYGNITQGFQRSRSSGEEGCADICGALGGTLSFPSLILIAGGSLGGRGVGSEAGKVCWTDSFTLSHTHTRRILSQSHKVLLSDLLPLVRLMGEQHPVLLSEWHSKFDLNLLIF